MLSRVVIAEEVGLGRLDPRPVGLGAMDAEEGLLDDVLRLADAADHPVGDREQQRPELFVGRFGSHAATDEIARAPVTAPPGVTAKAPTSS